MCSTATSIDNTATLRGNTTIIHKTIALTGKETLTKTTAFQVTQTGSAPDHQGL